MAKRTYTVEIEFPNNIDVEDWKVHNLLATQIEKAQVRMKTTGQMFNLKVKNIESVAVEEEVVEEPFNFTRFVDELLRTM